jgi:hypothetical protein
LALAFIASVIFLVSIQVISGKKWLRTTPTTSNYLTNGVFIKNQAVSNANSVAINA